MKICPKCGQEYEGDRCLKCEGPKIIINDNDYLERKKAYEKKQADLEKSASSHKKDNSINDELLQTVKKIKDDSKKKISSARKKTSTDRADKRDGKESTDKKNKDNAINIRKATLSLKKKRQIFIISVVAAIVLIAAAGFGIYKLATRKNYVLYMSSNDKIYNVSNLESSYICDKKDAVFTCGKNTFFTPEWPSAIDKSQVVDSMASDSGKYFVAVTYDSTKAEYSMTGWVGGGKVTKIYSNVESDNLLRKDIKYVSDDGIVIYSQTEVINDYGKSGAITLYMSVINKGNSQVGTESVNQSIISADIRDAYIYPEDNKVIYYTTGNGLYLYDYEKRSRVLIADDVTDICAMSDSYENTFVHGAHKVNQLSAANAIVYRVDNEYIYYNIENGGQISFGDNILSNAEFAYDKKNSSVYIIDGTNLYYATITDGVVSEKKQIDKFGNTANYLYRNSSEELIYINSEGRLMIANKDKVKQLDDGVSEGSLDTVGNTDNGITYTKNEKRIYRKSPSSGNVELEGTSSETSKIYFYKNRLYYYTSDGTLCSSTVKGKDYNQIGNVDMLWLGEELR
ncbi:MAG: hypothetical protein MR675_00615 [Lachnospira sp.]|nr:hypothetical protein [Lachnospira sp.]